MAIFDAFLKLDGIKGEGPGGAITLESFSWGVSHSGSASAGGGGGAGRASFQDFSFMSAAASESPHLFLACASGQHIPKGELDILTGNTTLFKITFSDVLISHYKIGEMTIKLDLNGQPTTDLGAPMQNVSFNFSKAVFQSLGAVTTTEVNPG